MQEKETVGPLFKVHQIIRNTKHLRITLSSKNEFAPPCHFNGKFHNVILIWLPYLFFLHHEIDYSEFNMFVIF